MSNKFKDDAEHVLSQWIISDSFVMGDAVSYKYLTDLIATALQKSWDNGFSNKAKLVKMRKKVRK